MRPATIFDMSGEGNFEYVASVIPIQREWALSVCQFGRKMGIHEFVPRRNAI
jgi:hypothetical protein